MAGGEWYWCTHHERVESTDGACAQERLIGPFPTAEQAHDWKSTIASNNDRWDDADRAWEGDDEPDPDDASH